MLQVPMKDDRKTGYKFLQPTSSGAFHAGEDLNSGDFGAADFKLPIKPMAKGEVIYVRNGGPGWGNIVVIWHEELKVWSRYAHFYQVYVKEGDLVDLNTVLGLCGKSGTASVHCHWEVIIKKLSRWTLYPIGWRRKQVLEYWTSPYEFINKQIMIESLPEWTREDWKEGQALGLPFQDPNQEIDLVEFQAMAKHYGLIKEINKMPAYRANTLLLKWKRALNS